MWKELKLFGSAGTKHPPVWWGGYVLGLLLAGAALGARLVLDPWLEDYDVWSFFFLASVAAAWWLGWRPGVVTAGAGLVLGLYFVIPPRHTLLLPHLYDWVGIGTYAFVAAALLVVVRRAQWQQQRLRETAQGLAGELDFSQAVVDSLPGLFYMLDEEGRLRRWNKRMERVSGYSAAELDGKPGLELAAPEDQELVREKMREVFSMGRAQAEVQLLTRHGQRLPYFYTGRRFSHAGRTGLVGTGVDISERKKAEAARATLAAIVEHSDDAIIGEALDGTITSWNRGAERIFGYTAQEVLGRPASFLASSGLHEEITHHLERLRRGEALERTETERFHKDGRRITLSLSVSPIKDEQGRLIGLAKIAHDVTQLKQAEAQLREHERLLREHAGELERRVEERTAQLREAMADMEQMSYSMIHDLRAPLRAIESFGAILAAQPALRLDAQGRELLEKMRTAARRMDHLVRDALNYNHIVREALPLGPVDVEALVRGIVATYPDFQPPKAVVEVTSGLPRVIGNEAALTQCFSQLLDNAVKFAKPGRQAHVRIWGEEASGERMTNGKWQSAEGGAQGEGNELLVANAGRAEIPDMPVETESAVRTPNSALAPHAAFVRIWVRDDGVGIDREAQGTIFKLFQRLSTEGKGTGMGLPIVKKAVERMGGRVGVESELGVGSRFWVELRKG